ncbi:MAG TPA: LysM peptidoglycan-binding domain-containing protein [Deltaproteobacteria bacterium]|nr:LysM peptidoglycan-binding domain-containing protein [Deltaproteobacteria bacterium]
MALLLSLFGCMHTGKESWPPVQARQKLTVHVVQWPGETLPIIAQWYTGNSRNWKELVNANPNIVPGRLAAGDRIIVPAKLLKTTKMMPKEFMQPLLAPSSPQPSSPADKAPSTPDKDEFELFGPK